MYSLPGRSNRLLMTWHLCQILVLGYGPLDESD